MWMHLRETAVKGTELKQDTQSAEEYRELELKPGLEVWRNIEINKLYERDDVICL